MPSSNSKTVPPAQPFKDSTTPPPGTFGEDRPRRNVLLFIGDDYGNDMIASYRVDSFLPADFAAHPLTPTLESMISSGVRFRRMAVQPSCTPTRAEIETGRYGFRTGIGTVTTGAAAGAVTELGFGPGSVVPLEVTLPRLLAARGYSSGRVGKWHIALPNDAQDPGFVHEPVHGLGWEHPIALGYDHFAGTFWNLDRQPYPGASGGFLPGHYNYFWWDSSTGIQEQVVGVYSTTKIIDEAIEMVTSRLPEPWVCVVAFNAAHSPFGPATGGASHSGCMPPADLIHSAPGTYDANPANPNRSLWDSFRASIEAIDFEMGRMLTTMGDMAARTDVLFIGDNGTPSAVWQAATDLGVSNLGTILPNLLSVNRFKSTVYEAGIRVPYVVSSPIVRAAPRSTQRIMDAPDVFETIRHLTASDRDASVPVGRALDGLSHVPILQLGAANAFHPRRWRLAQRWSPNGPPSASDSLQSGFARISDIDGVTYKLVRRAGEPDELYRLYQANIADQDPWEQTPLAFGPGDTYRAQYLEIVDALAEVMSS